MLTEQECRRLPPTLVPVGQRGAGNRAADRGVDREALGWRGDLRQSVITSDGLVLLGVATVVGAVGGELPQGGELGLGEI